LIYNIYSACFGFLYNVNSQHETGVRPTTILQSMTLSQFTHESSSVSEDQVFQTKCSSPDVIQPHAMLHQGFNGLFDLVLLRACVHVAITILLRVDECIPHMYLQPACNAWSGFPGYIQCIWEGAFQCLSQFLVL